MAQNFAHVDEIYLYVTVLLMHQLQLFDNIQIFIIPRYYSRTLFLGLEINE